ncbi:MAG: ferric iron uptake transcriptional regulator [Gammaproteobacteria bacterium]
MTESNLKQAGLKVTGPRLKILEILSNQSNTGTGQGRHLSAEDIYKILRESGNDTSLATVYRSLTQFETVGLVIRHKFDDDYAVFELSDSEHHDHLVCTSCNKVIEFVDKIIETRQEEIAKTHDFKITGHSLYIFGICRDCVLN